MLEHRRCFFGNICHESPFVEFCSIDVFVELLAVIAFGNQQEQEQHDEKNVVQVVEHKRFGQKLAVEDLGKGVGLCSFAALCGCICLLSHFFLRF